MDSKGKINKMKFSSIDEPKFWEKYFHPFQGGVRIERSITHGSKIFECEIFGVGVGVGVESKEKLSKSSKRFPSDCKTLQSTMVYA